jgi:ABC-type amino acid transport system permease subunit
MVAFTVALAAYPMLYRGFIDAHHFVSAGRVPLTVSIAIAVTISACPLSVLGAMCTVGLRLFRGRVRRWQALIVGMIVGNIPILFFATLASLASVRRGAGFGLRRVLDAAMLRPIALGSVLGLACALVFWQIAGPALRPAPRT